MFQLKFSARRIGGFIIGVNGILIRRSLAIKPLLKTGCRSIKEANPKNQQSRSEVV